MSEPVDGWLPPGRDMAVCFTVDDVHPGRSTDAYEAGGDLGDGALGHLAWLLERHASLRATLFVTADWREREPFVTRPLLARVPGVRDHAWLVRRLPPGTMALHRHPAFVEHLRGLPRTEVALHGLHHVHRGRRVMVEFQDEDVDACMRTLRRAKEIMRLAGLSEPTGMTPPGWEAPPALLEAMARSGLAYVASARDVRSPVARGARTAMSGLHGMSLIGPTVLDGGLVHLPANVQATSPVDRALAIAELGGLVSVKAHIVKSAFGHVALDGLDELYRNYLDQLFWRIDAAYGDRVWWATMGEVAARVRETRAERESPACSST